MVQAEGIAHAETQGGIKLSVFQEFQGDRREHSKQWGEGGKMRLMETEVKGLGVLVKSLHVNLKQKPLEDLEQGNAYGLIFVFKKRALATVERRNVFEGGGEKRRDVLLGVSHRSLGRR